MPNQHVPTLGPVRCNSGRGLLLLSALLTLLPVRAADLPTVPLADITYAAGRYVAVGPAGRRFWSADGTAWQAASPAQANAYVAVTHTGTRFAALTAEGKIFESPDGSVWSPLGQVEDTPSATGLAYGAGRYVVVDESGYISSSTNGRDWVAAFEPSANAFESLYRVAYGGGRFVAVGVDETSTKPYSLIRTSPDGLKWTRERHLGNEELRGVSFLDNQFACVGLLSSDDADASLLLTQVPGSTWNRQTLPGDSTLQGIAQGQGVWAAVGDGGAIQVFDGSAWSRRWAGDPPPDLTAIAYGPAGFIAVGNTGVSVRSVDGKSWISANPFAGADLTCITAGPGVIVGGGPLLAGALWIREPNGEWGNTFYEDAGGESAAIHGVCRGTDLYVAVGGVYDEDFNSHGLLLTSADGRFWQPAPLTSGEEFYGVTFGGGRFVAVGQRDGDIPDTIRTSTNGTDWAYCSPNTGQQGMGLLAVTYGDGQFVATGWSGGIVSSFDGIHWEPMESGVFANLNAVTHAFGQFVAVGSGGTVAVSADGEIWDQRSVGQAHDLAAVVQHQDAVYCVGTGGFMARSTDLRTWTPVNCGITNNLTGLTSQGTTLWVVGEQGAILGIDTAPTEAAHLQVQIDPTNPARVRVDIHGAPHSMHRLESCPVLESSSVWSLQQTVVLDADGRTTIPLPLENLARFYRSAAP